MGDLIVSELFDKRTATLEFHSRIQLVMDALATWRRLAVIEMSRGDIDEIERDDLHFELMEAGIAINEFALAAERMKGVREGGEWPRT
jgi:hypothetical protein